VTEFTARFSCGVIAMAKLRILAIDHASSARSDYVAFFFPPRKYLQRIALRSFIPNILP
jgi:hypothetical protein